MANTAPSDRHWQPPLAERRLLLMVGDTLAILIAVLLSFVIWIVVDGRGLGLHFILTHAYWFPILAALWLLLANANDVYNLRIAAKLDTSLLRLIQVTLQLLVVYLVIFFFAPRTALPRLFIFYYGVLSFVLIVGWRSVRPLLFAGRDLRRRAVIIGTGWTASIIIDVLHQEAAHDYEIVGQIIEFDADEAIPVSAQVLIIEATGDLTTLVQREQVSEIILANGRELSAPLFQAIMDCYEQGLRIMPMPLLYEHITGRVPVEHVGQRYWTAMLPVEGDAISALYTPLKRLSDIVLSLVGLVILAPLLPVLTLAMQLDSPGPLLFRQARTGQGGRTFDMLKLRSMIPDAERDTGPQWASLDDPRVTRVGRFLRRTRLDEVPQLINVLRGDMSLIGPRPERPEFVASLSQSIPFYRARHAIKPGVTGWAQVRYHYGSSEEDALIKLQYDLYYIRHRSLALDLLILLRTAGKILSLQGT